MTNVTCVHFYLLVTTGYLVDTSDYLVIVSGYLIANTGYFWLLLVTSHYFWFLVLVTMSKPLVKGRPLTNNLFVSTHIILET